MNLSPSNNAANSSHPTPVTQEPTGEPSPVSFEQYRSPLVNSYFTPNYATLRVSSSIQDADDPPEVPPLPTSPSLHHNSLTAASTPLHYRSLQSTPVISPKSKIFNLGNHFPVATDPPNRKRYHTAPREKHRVSVRLLHFVTSTALL